MSTTPNIPNEAPRLLEYSKAPQPRHRFNKPRGFSYLTPLFPPIFPELHPNFYITSLYASKSDETTPSPPYCDSEVGNYIQSAITAVRHPPPPPPVIPLTTPTANIPFQIAGTVRNPISQKICTSDKPRQQDPRKRTCYQHIPPSLLSLLPCHT